MRSAGCVEGQRRNRNSRVGKLPTDIDMRRAGPKIGLEAVAGLLDVDIGRQLQRERHGLKGRGEASVTGCGPFADAARSSDRPGIPTSHR